MLNQPVLNEQALCHKPSIILPLDGQHRLRCPAIHCEIKRQQRSLILMMDNQPPSTIKDVAEIIDFLIFREFDTISSLSPNF